MAGLDKLAALCEGLAEANGDSSAWNKNTTIDVTATVTSTPKPF